MSDHTIIRTIQTQRLTLRGFVPADIPALHAIVSNREVLRYFPRTEPWERERVERSKNAPIKVANECTKALAALT